MCIFICLHIWMHDLIEPSFRHLQLLATLVPRMSARVTKIHQENQTQLFFTFFTLRCWTNTCWSALGSAWETLPQFGRQSLRAHHLIEVMPPQPQHRCRAPSMLPTALLDTQHRCIETKEANCRSVEFDCTAKPLSNHCHVLWQHQNQIMSAQETSFVWKLASRSSSQPWGWCND